MWLIETKDFIPRTHCAINGWPFYLEAINKYSNLFISIIYWWIAGWLIFLWIKKRKHIPRSKIFYLFATFISLCGFTHASNYLAFTFPAYRLFTLIDFITAIVSIITGICLPPVIFYALKMPSIERLYYANQLAQEELTKRELIEAEQKQFILELKNNVNLLELELKQFKWRDEKYQNIEKIKKMLVEAS